MSCLVCMCGQLSESKRYETLFVYTFSTERLKKKHKKSITFNVRLLLFWLFFSQNILYTMIRALLWKISLTRLTQYEYNAEISRCNAYLYEWRLRRTYSMNDDELW